MKFTGRKAIEKFLKEKRTDGMQDLLESWGVDTLRIKYPLAGCKDFIAEIVDYHYGKYDAYEGGCAKIHFFDGRMNEICCLDHEDVVELEYKGNELIVTSHWIPED